MTNATEVKKELTVSQYEFYKSGGMTDAKVMEIHGLDHNQLYKWKKVNDLVGKDYGLRGGPSVKVYKAEEVQPLKENDIPKGRLTGTYSPNKQIQEKLAEKKPEKTGWEKVKELTDQMSQEMKTEVLAAAEESVKAPSIEETQTDIGLSLMEQLDNLRKEKALLEEQHVKNNAEKDSLREELESMKRRAKYFQRISVVSEEVKAERYRQIAQYDLQNHPRGVWLSILAEEFGEVAQAMQRGEGWGKESDADDLFKELTHVSAVANAWAEQVLEEREANLNG